MDKSQNGMAGKDVIQCVKLRPRRVRWRRMITGDQYVLEVQPSAPCHRNADHGEENDSGPKRAPKTEARLHKNYYAEVIESLSLRGLRPSRGAVTQVGWIGEGRTNRQEPRFYDL